MFELEKHLISLTKDNLNLHMVDQAVFFAERLNASYINDDNLHLLGECYLRQGQAQRVLNLLEGMTSEQNRYLYAVAALKINRLDEAESALVPNENNEVPKGAYGYYLLGKIARQKSKTDSAAKFFLEALNINPELWVAYKELCEIGKAPVPQQAISLSFITEEISKAIGGGVAVDQRQSSHDRDPLTPDVSIMDTNQTNNRLGNQVFTSGYQYASEGSVDGDGGGGDVGIMKEVPISRRKVFDKVVKMVRTDMVQEIPIKVDQPTTIRRSARIQEKQQLQQGQGITQSTQQIPTYKHSSQSRVKDGQDQHQNQNNGANKQGLNHTTLLRQNGRLQFIKLLRQLGQGYYHLCRHACRAAVEAFYELPEQQLSSAWVMIQIGRAYYEAVEYDKAIECFEKAVRLDPSNVHGLEYYSTVLYLTKNEVELSQLSHQAIKADRLAPETWCVMGNCFSLQKEHDIAIKYFQRAIQLDTNFGYAYSLLGHEYFAMENHEKATVCFRNAMVKDRLSYNAWYGLGCIYYREEKYDLAYYHFEEARKLNPDSSVIYCYYGMTQNKLKQHDAALASLDYARKLDRKNPLPRNEKAMMLAENGRIQESIIEFEELRELLPSEATTCLHLGRLYKKMNEFDLALMRLREAIDLTQSNTECNLIKSIIDKIHIMDVDEQPDL